MCIFSTVPNWSKVKAKSIFLIKFCVRINTFVEMSSCTLDSSKTKGTNIESGFISGYSWAIPQRLPCHGLHCRSATPEHHNTLWPVDLLLNLKAHYVREMVSHHMNNWEHVPLWSLFHIHTAVACVKAAIRIVKLGHHEKLIYKIKCWNVKCQM